VSSHVLALDGRDKKFVADSTLAGRSARSATLNLSDSDASSMFGGGGGGGLDPRKMKQMMKQMGIDVDELDAEEVVITKSDGEELVFDDPEITVMDARGQETYQVVGEPETRDSTAGAVESGAESESGGGSDTSGSIPDEDVEIVAQRTGASQDDARAALEATDGDLAAAVERLE
jgi:nascent polypeptide-associated complex subunit alpha